MNERTHIHICMGPVGVSFRVETRFASARPRASEVLLFAVVVVPPARPVFGSGGVWGMGGREAE